MFTQRICFIKLILQRFLFGSWEINFWDFFYEIYLSHALTFILQLWVSYLYVSNSRSLLVSAVDTPGYPAENSESWLANRPGKLYSINVIFVLILYFINICAIFFPEINILLTYLLINVGSQLTFILHLLVYNSYLTSTILLGGPEGGQR